MLKLDHLFLLMVSFSFSFWTLSNLFWDLAPLLKPPISFLNFWFSLKLVLKALAKLLRSPSSSFLTSVKATTAAFFWWTSWPNLAFPLTKQYGISIFLQRVGSQTTSSMGSTLLAITTSLAFFSSMSLVTWLRPNFKWKGLVFSTVFSTIKEYLLSALVLASWTSLVFLWALSSGEYFLRSLKSTLVWFLSSAFENWAISGGTLILVKRILFCLWKVIYLGHLTNLVRFLLGWILLPTLKLRGLLWKSGLVFF